MPTDPLGTAAAPPAGLAEDAVGPVRRPLDAVLLVAAALCAHAAWVGPGWSRGAEGVAVAGVSLALGAALVLSLRPVSRRSGLAVLPLVWGAAAALELGPQDARGLVSALAASVATLALAAQHAARTRRDDEAVAWVATSSVHPSTRGLAWSGPLAATLIIGATAPPAVRLARAATAAGVWHAGLVALGLGLGLWLAHGVLAPRAPRLPDARRRLIWTLLAFTLLGGAWWLRRRSGAAQ